MAHTGSGAAHRVRSPAGPGRRGPKQAWRRALLALAALALLGVACDDADAGTDAEGGAAAADPPAAASAFPRTIEDSSGASVTIEASPQRIVSHSPGATEILFAIGAGGRVVAADEFSDYPPETAQLERVAYANPDPERELALDPDLVLMAANQLEQVEQFRDLGLTVLYVEEASTVAGVVESVRFFGELTGDDERAEALAEEMGGRIAAVTAELADIEAGPRVFFELDGTLYTVGTDTFVGDLLTLLRASNIAEGAASAFPQLTAEAVIEANPEVVLLADGEFGESIETVCARPGWSAIAACETGRVHAIDPDLTNRPGPRVVEGLEEIARLLYPERFAP